MGRDKRFVEGSNHAIECCICSDVLLDPVEGCANDHLFCLSCIETWKSMKSMKGTCPTCRLPLHEKFNIKRSIKEIIARMKVYCNHYGDDWWNSDSKKVFNEKGCMWSGPLDELVTHLQTCISFRVFCPNAGCDKSEFKESNKLESKERNKLESKESNKLESKEIEEEDGKTLAQIANKDLKQHLATCKYRPKACDHCKVEMPLIKIKDHVNTVCPEAKITCVCKEHFKRKDQAKHVCRLEVISCSADCGIRLTREEMANHLKENLLSHYLAMTSQMQKLQTQLSSVIYENQALTQRLAQSEKVCLFSLLFSYFFCCC